MKYFDLKIKFYDPTFAQMVISRDTLPEIETSKIEFLKRQDSVSWDDNPENALAQEEKLTIDNIPYILYAHSDFFYFELVDNSATMSRDSQIKELQDEEDALMKMLEDTDYLVIREMEAGIAFDAAIKAERAAARTRISDIRVMKGLL